jgi:hypothetical protein
MSGRIERLNEGRKKAGKSMVSAELCMAQIEVTGSIQASMPLVAAQLKSIEKTAGS